MNTTKSDRGNAESARIYDAFFNLETGHWHRGPDRREEGGGLFGYVGPERRSGRDRRAPG
jgi:hypothetical protein